MSYIKECLDNVRLGDPVTHLNLTMYPLEFEERMQPTNPDYDLLDQALLKETARITEISESGSVPTLNFDNAGENPVLLLDGEELVGAKQNRILNLTILAPAGKKIEVPVSCVEAGRWSRVSDNFQAAPRAHFARGRARKAEAVSHNMEYRGYHQSNQAEVWEDIAEKSEALDAFSASGAAEAMYDTHRGNLDGYKSAFSTGERQPGALFAIDGKIVGLDLFDSPAALRKLFPKLLESYALDAVEAAMGRSSQVHVPESDIDSAAARFIEDTARARVLSTEALGEGEDLRLRSDEVSGGALYAMGRIVHLCAFARNR